jgi:hypothetical protein
VAVVLSVGSVASCGSCIDCGSSVRPGRGGGVEPVSESDSADQSMVESDDASFPRNGNDVVALPRVPFKLHMRSLAGAPRPPF